MSHERNSTSWGRQQGFQLVKNSDFVHEFQVFRHFILSYSTQRCIVATYSTEERNVDYTHDVGIQTRQSLTCGRDESKSLLFDLWQRKFEALAFSPVDSDDSPPNAVKPYLTSMIQRARAGLVLNNRAEGDMMRYTLPSLILSTQDELSWVSLFIGTTILQ